MRQLPENFCIDLYKNLYVEPMNADQLRIAPCCQSLPSTEKIVNFDFKSSKHLSSLRDKFSKNQQPSECNRCWEKEKFSIKSRRIETLEHYTPVDDQVELESLDINVTWACNLTCVMCSPRWSSAWAKELNVDRDRLSALGKLQNSKNSFIDQLEIDKVKQIHFNGGEPLINQNHYNILQKFDHNNLLSNIAVSYNTNGTVYPTSQVFDIWAKAKIVKLLFSIDATELAFEYIRYPASWQQVDENIKNIKKNAPSNVMFGINVTVGSYNLLELTHISKWFTENLCENREGDVSDFSWNFVNQYPVDAVPDSVKQVAIKELSNDAYFSEVADYLRITPSQNNDNWIKDFEKIDQRRGTSWRRNLTISNYY